MIEALLIKITSLLSFVFGCFKGKKDDDSKQLEKGMKDVLNTQKRRAKRAADTDDAVIKRMRKFTRK